MPDSFPLVTVVALCFNHSKYVVKTLDSIIYQTYPNIQLIIIDNSSMDDSVLVIKSWLEQHKDLNISFYSNSSNVGICAALNQGLALAKGKYYQMVSCDDILEVDKFEKQVKIFEEGSASLAFVYGNEKFIDESGNLLDKKSYIDIQGWTHNDDLPAGRIQELLLNNYFLRAPTILYRTSCVIEIGGYYEHIPFEDFQMNIRLLSRYSCKGIVDILCLYRVLPNSFYNSSTNRTIEFNYFKTMKYVYGNTYYQNWIILLRYMNFDKSLYGLMIKNVVFFLLEKIAKRYKRLVF